MKCQILFAGKNKKTYFKMLSSESSPRMLSVNCNMFPLLCLQKGTTASHVRQEEEEYFTTRY